MSASKLRLIVDGAIRSRLEAASMISVGEASRWKMSYRFVNSRVAWIHVTWMAVLFAPYLLQAAVFAQDSDVSAHQYRYSVIVDCGSSGSRAHLFRWAAKSTEPNKLLESLEPMRDQQTGRPLIRRVEPGLASLRDQPESASVYMKPIMEFVSAEIPKESQRETPIYFMATAGLRLLSRRERKAILDDIAKDLKRDYNFPEIHTRVISGAQEGAYEWFSINAHARRLAQQSDSFFGDTLHCKTAATRRLGLLEMGGASIQVAYELTDELDRLLTASLSGSKAALDAYQHSQIELNMDTEGQRKVRLFSATFLGLGSNSARDLAVDLLIRSSLPVTGLDSLAKVDYVHKLELNDPCLPREASEITVKPLDILQDKSRTIGFKAPESDQARLEVTLKGTGNFRLCQRLVHQLLRLAKSEKLNCHDNEEASANFCPMSLLGQPFVPLKFVQFVGLGDLFHTTNEMIHAAGKFNFFAVRARAASICSTPYNLLVKLYPEATRKDSKRILHECFKANWVLAFLGAGLGVSPKTSRQVETVDKVNGQEVDYTFGAMTVKLFNELTCVVN